jgi:2-keto-4-pentenoate hydratase
MTTGKNGASEAVSVAARRILDAYASRIACDPVRELIGDRDVEAAYAVQEINTRHWLASGRRMVGRKIGLTSKAVQAQLGVDQPDFGILFEDMAVPDGGEIAIGLLMQPKIEAEIALVLKAPLTRVSHTVADVVAATDHCVAALEIVGSRIRNWDIRLADTIADNASGSHYVLGTERRSPDRVDMVGCRMELRRGGEVVSSGTGAACMGNPLEAAVWLADTMVKVGRPLAAGDVILTGALGPMVPVSAGDRFVAAIDGLGQVSVSFAG